MRGFSIDQTRYDPRLSYDINRRRADDAVRTQYMEIAERDRMQANQNAVMTRVIKPPAERLTVEQIRMKILRREAQRRARISALFEEERQAFVRLTGEQQATHVAQESDRLQARVDELRAVRRTERDEFNQRKREQQFEENCDELRGQQEFINARACRLQWGLQEAADRRRKAQEKAIDRALDGMTVADFKQYQIDVQEAYKQKLQEMQKYRGEIEQELELQLKNKTASKQEAFQQHQAEQALRRLGAEIEQMQKNLILQENKQVAKEIQLQHSLALMHREKAKQAKLQEGREEVIQVRNDMEAERLKALETQQTQLQIQELYQAVERQRKEEQENYRKAVDQAFLMDVKQRDQNMAERERTEEQQRRAIAAQQTMWNVEIAEEKRLGLEKKKQKDADLIKAIADLEQFKNDERERYSKNLQQQQEYLKYLLGQDQERVDKFERMRKEDVEYANRQKQQQIEDRRVIEGKLGALQDRVRELDSVNIEDPQPYIPRKQWYNV